jgi:2-oxoglutarate dehydrogenase E1 component
MSTTQISTTREQVLEVYRRWGHLQAQLDPLGQYLAASPLPEPVPSDADPEDVADAKRLYASTVAAEFMHIADRVKRDWVASRLEGAIPDRGSCDQQCILDQLIRADIFESVIQSRYLGTKRFSLEGVTVLIPFLDEVFHRAAELGAEKVMMGMSHRGRLSVMVNTLRKRATDIFSKFEDVNPRSFLGGGDVKYHVGATGEFPARNGKTLAMHLASNPSHLEAVDPVAMGRTRAKQARYGAEGTERVLPVVIHGDSAFAGQGITAETLNISEIDGYEVGGTIHVVVNNLIGFTAEPGESMSSRYSTDVAKRLQVPIFHVNAEDPDAVVRIARLAAEYRYEFKTDVVIDLVGYRRHGHSEVDDPTITQPIRYARIKKHPPLYEIYAKRIGSDYVAKVREVQSEFIDAQRAATNVKNFASLAKLPEYWSPYKGGAYKPEYEVETGLTAAEVGELSARLSTYPAKFHVHPKIQKLLEQRAEMGQGLRPFDYGMAEAVAVG